MPRLLSTNMLNIPLSHFYPTVNFQSQSLFYNLYMFLPPSDHKWGLLGKYPIFTVVMEIYRYVEIIGEFSLLPIFLYNIYDHEKYYPGKPVNIHIKSLINIMQEKNWVVTN